MEINLDRFKGISKNKSEENKKFLQRLKKQDARKLDGAFHEVHEAVFAETDCLTCANCCKTTSPIFYQTDIERASKFLRMKPGDFIEKYLRVDEDKDFVLKSSPCAFLGADNYCSIYEARPKACREYPHTDRPRFYQILNLTLKNSYVCPAAYQVMKGLKENFKK